MPRKPQFGRIFQRTKREPGGIMITLPTWWIAYYVDGAERRESSKSEKYKDAEGLLRQRQAEMHLGSIAPSNAKLAKVSALLDGLIADYELNGKSVEWARDVANHLRPFFGEMRAAAVGTTVIQQYIERRHLIGRSNATINRELALLRRAYNLGLKATPPIVSRVPRIPKLKESPPRKGFFEHDQFTAIRMELPEHLRPVITFGYWTGCRKGEILGLRWEQVDLIEQTVRLDPGETKNDEPRVIPLAGELLETLKLQRSIRDVEHSSCNWVFFDYRTGARIRSFRTAWAYACARAGLVTSEGAPLGNKNHPKAARLFHDLRRTGVRNLIRAGVSEKVAMQISGHKTRAVFDRYNITDERDLHIAARRLADYHSARENASNTDTMRTPEATTETSTSVTRGDLLQ